MQRVKHLNMVSVISGFRSCALRTPEYQIPLPGAWAERTYFLVHGDGGSEEDEEGGSQKGEAQE